MSPLIYEALSEQGPNNVFECSLMSDADLELDYETVEGNEKSNQLEDFSSEIFEIILMNRDQTSKLILEQIQNIEVLAEDELARYKEKIKVEYVERLEDIRNCVKTMQEYVLEKKVHPSTKKIEEHIMYMKKHYENSPFKIARFLGSKCLFSKFQEELIFKKHTSESIIRFIEALIFTQNLIFMTGTPKPDLMEFGRFKVFLMKMKETLLNASEDLLRYNQEIHAKTELANREMN